MTIPKPLRERLGIETGQVVEFTEIDGALVLKRVVERAPDLEFDPAHTDKSADELLLELQRLRR